MKIQFLFFILFYPAFSGELPANWETDWPQLLKSETLQNQYQFFPLVSTVRSCATMSQSGQKIVHIIFTLEMVDLIFQMKKCGWTLTDPAAFEQSDWLNLLMK